MILIKRKRITLVNPAYIHSIIVEGLNIHTHIKSCMDVEVICHGRHWKNKKEKNCKLLFVTLYAALTNWIPIPEICKLKAIETT